MTNRFIADFKQKFRSTTGKKGFTLMEVVLAVAVIAVISGIMIPSVISINNSLTNRQADDYAKSIYLAAQTQLSTMRAEKPKALSETLTSSAAAIPETDNADFEGTWNSSLRYVVSGRDQDFLDNVLLPVGSIDDTLRSKKIMIEYNSLTGEVLSVFFLDKTATAADYLTYGGVTRSSAERKAIHLGYYQADASSTITLPESYTEDLFNCEILSFYNNYDNNGDGVVKVLVPIPDGYRDATRFADSLSVKMTIEGKTSGAKKVVDLTDDLSGRTSRLTSTDLSLDGHPAVGFSYIIDSIYTSGLGFDELVTNSGFRIGENISLSVEITDTSDVTTFEGTPQSLTINPMYAELSNSTLVVANARNLQNLNKYAVSEVVVNTVKLSDSIDSDGIVWYTDKVFTPLKNVCGFKVFDGNGKKISGLTINDSSISGNSVGFFTALTADSKDSKPVVKNLTLDGLTIDLDNSASKSVGAIVGSATDVKVSNCAATNISFTLDKANASTYVGGLVGVMKGGTLEGNSAGNVTTVSGTITKKSGTTGNVGGAVGRDDTGKFSTASVVDSAVYSKVNAAVELKSWDGTVSPASAGDPSGLGVNVGKFVGYVNSGIFSDCSGTGNSDKPYQFLGQIAYNISALSGNYFLSKNGSQKTYSSADETGTYTSLSAYAESKGMTAKTSNNGYTASLTNCTFENTDVLYKQVIDSEYLYLGTEGDGSAEITGAGVRKITSLSKSNLSADRDTTRYIIYDTTNNAILLLPDLDGKHSSTPPSPVIGNKPLLITKENNANFNEGNYGWGFNEFIIERDSRFYLGINSRDTVYFSSKGFFGAAAATAGSYLAYTKFENGEFTFFDEGHYLKFDKDTRTYTLTKASSLPDDAPHFVLYEYKMSGLSSESTATEYNTLVFNYTPAGYTLNLQSVTGSICTYELLK